MRRAHGPMWSATNAIFGARGACFGMSAVFLGGNAAFRVRCGVLGCDAARRVATKAVRGLCIDGHRLERNDIPANADCRGGVFAVFAKIPPPVLPRVLHGYKPWAYSPSSGQPARYLRGVEAGILSLPSEFCKSPLGAIFYGGAFPLWRVNGF